MRRQWSVVACGLVSACMSPGAADEYGRAVQGLNVGAEVSFPSPSVSPVAAIPGPVSVVSLANQRWMGFPSSAGFQRVTVDDQWTVRSAASPMTAAWAVLVGQGSTMLGAWNVGFPAVTLHIGAFSSTGAVMGTPAVFPTIGAEISNPPTSGPAIAAFGGGALVAWPSAAGGPVVRVVRVNAAGVPLDPVAGVAISAPGQPTDSLSIACLTTSCLVAWTDTNSITPRDTFVRRIGANGMPLDPAPVRVASGFLNRLRPVVSHDGTNFLVVWHQSDTSSPAPGVYARRMSGASGAWLDPAPVLLHTLPGQSQPVEAHRVSSAVVWDGTVWGIVTYGTTPWRFASLGPDGRVVTPSRELPGTTVASYVTMVASPAGWEGIYGRTGLFQFALSSTGSVLRYQAPVVDAAGPGQGVQGLGFAGGRFVVQLYEGFWRVTPSGVREGAGPVPNTSMVFGNPLALSAASGDQLLLSFAHSVADVNRTLTVRLLPASLGSPSAPIDLLRLSRARSSVLGTAPGGGFLGMLSAGDGLAVGRISLTGASVYNVLIPSPSTRPAFASSATHTLVARTRSVNTTGVTFCVRELFVLDASGQIVAQRELGRMQWELECDPDVSHFMASNGTSFLYVRDGVGQIVTTAAETITLARSLTWTTGTPLAVVWDGSAYVVLTRNTADDLFVQRVTSAGDSLDPAGVLVGRSTRSFLASDGAGRTAVLYTRPEGSVRRSVLRIIDWTSRVDAGVDAGTDTGPRDTGIDTGVDTGPRDTGIDTGPRDTGVIPMMDTGVDGGVIPMLDTGVDGGVIPMLDTGVDAAEDAALDAGTPGLDVGVDVGRDVGREAAVATDTGVGRDASTDTGDAAMPPPDDGDGGCSVGPGAPTGGGRPVLGLAMLAAVSVLRRRRLRSAASLGAPWVNP